jgi:hypothetical protein
MAIGTSAGTTVSISTTATSATTVSALAALTYTVISKVETLGEIGPQAQDVSFTPLAGDDVQHLKGATDNGAVTITCAKDPLDPGQIALLAAAMSTNKLEYAIKITESDGADANDTDTVTYVRGPVMGGRKTIGGANDVTKRAFMVGINVYRETQSVAVP